MATSPTSATNVRPDMVVTSRDGWVSLVRNVSVVIHFENGMDEVYTWDELVSVEV